MRLILLDAFFDFNHELRRLVLRDGQVLVGFSLDLKFDVRTGQSVAVGVHQLRLVEKTESGSFLFIWDLSYDIELFHL